MELDWITGALRRLTPIYAALRLDAVKNDAARAAQAQNQSSALLNKKSSAYTCATRATAIFQLRRQPAARPRRARAAAAPGAAEGTRRGPRTETKRPLTINTQDDDAQRRRRGRHRQ